MENIELRSEQVRKIIGQIPPVLVRSGISIIGVIIALLLAAAAFVPYPETVECNVTLSDIQEGQVIATGELSYNYITQIKPGLNAEIELEGYTSNEYGYQEGVIITVSPQALSRNGRNYFSFTLSLKEASFMQKGMKGRASIILSKKTLLRRIWD